MTADISRVAPALRHGEAPPPTVLAYRNLPKRLLDVLLVLLAAPVALPLVAVLALVVARDGALPFYWQVRVGRSGRTFRMLKIRTMVADADSLLSGHLEADPTARAEWDRTQKLKDDPRITRFGAFLRKSSLDELPQLWNVLVGDMSLVGPRPMMECQRGIYPGTAYYALRPGITGPWQVSERNETSFAERARYDEAYLGGLSFQGDISLLLRTVGVVLRGTGR